MKRVMNVKVFSNKRYGFIWAGLGFFLVGLMGVFDYLTGPVFSSLVFYLVPVIFVIWSVGRSAGVWISITSALTWVLTYIISSLSHTNLIIPFWNRAEKLGIFFIVVYILLRLARKEEALKFEREQFFSILDTSEALICVVDPESYEIIYTNSAFSNLFGADILGKKCYEKLQGVEKPCDFCTNQYIFGKNIGKTYIWEHQDQRSQRWFRYI